ncbi:MAG: CxxxxCH/CxxCH domain-containing protein [Thermodesulfobacteriota bacterium]
MLYRCAGSPLPTGCSRIYCHDPGSDVQAARTSWKSIDGIECKGC